MFSPQYREFLIEQVLHERSGEFGVFVGMPLCSYFPDQVEVAEFRLTLLLPHRGNQKERKKERNQMKPTREKFWKMFTDGFNDEAEEIDIQVVVFGERVWAEALRSVRTRKKLKKLAKRLRRIESRVATLEEATWPARVSQVSSLSTY